MPKGLKQPERRPMAVREVRYVGDPVTVVLAEDPYIAMDARDIESLQIYPCR